MRLACADSTGAERRILLVSDDTFVAAIDAEPVVREIDPVVSVDEVRGRPGATLSTEAS